MDVEKVLEDLIEEFGEDTVRKMIDKLVKELGVNDGMDKC